MRKDLISTRRSRKAVISSSVLKSHEKLFQSFASNSCRLVFAFYTLVQGFMLRNREKISYEMDFQCTEKKDENETHCTGNEWDKKYQTANDTAGKQGQ